ncbi:MAG TPA: hypothetical protein VF612_15600 [Jatrophihabitans sp.]|uniref:hypothetical protein n=1 Tax=Jatrophihabitans sp. TaxID=1932789 RepID=UPI002EE70EB0
MILQPNFAFWKFSYTGSTQAEVFLTITAILHCLRQRRLSKHATLFREHNWTVLAPGNFARYNDAVIQAALLRAARDFELDYERNDATSREMAEILRSIFAAWHEDEGAASAEFLMFMAQRKLRLHPDDARRCLEALHADKSELPVLLITLRDAATRMVKLNYPR